MVVNTENLEQQTGAKTLFSMLIGSNHVWGFLHENGVPGVAIKSSATGNHVVISLNNLREMVWKLEDSMAKQ